MRTACSLYSWKCRQPQARSVSCLTFSSLCLFHSTSLLPPSLPPSLTARSSASIALQMHPREFPHLQHFDFFTVNLNEEFSGLFGGVLHRQTRKTILYSVHCSTSQHLSSSRVCCSFHSTYPFSLPLSLTSVLDSNYCSLNGGCGCTSPPLPARLPALPHPHHRHPRLSSNPTSHRL